MSVVTSQTAAQYNLSVITCSKCGIDFWVPEHFKSTRQNDHESFYCPNGHKQYYPQQTEAEKLRERLRWQEQQTESNRRRAERKELQRRAAKGQTTRLKNRIAKGRCPCCGRHFDGLKEHMAKMHPDFGGK